MFVGSLAVTLFVLVIAYFGSRYLARRYFHEPGRAPVAAACVTLAFALGILIEMPLRPHAAPPDAEPIAAVNAQPAPQAQAQATGAPVTHVAPAAPVSSTSPSLTIAKAVGGRTQAQSDVLFASLDTVAIGDRIQRVSDETFVDLGSAEAVTIGGWAREPVKNDLARSVFLEVDHKLAFVASPAPIQRPDVAEFTKNPALAHAAFTVTVPASKLGVGTHYVSVLVIGADGKSYYRKDFLQTVAIRVR